MRYKIENIGTKTWHQIIEDLKASGFREVSRYTGMDAGIDYNQYDLADPAGSELLTFVWDNWSEGEVSAGRAQLEAIRERYHLSELIEVDPSAGCEAGTP